MPTNAEPEVPDTPDPGIAQDPGIPGFDVISDARDTPTTDAKDPSAELRERLDDADREGHTTLPEEDDA
ncbi:MAG: hypothetical protein H0V40_01265 [Actinobacteria bacterium]|nr:hypothetical protein [Actinomycetota bacterium]